MALTVAPGTTPPELSRTRPESWLRSNCAYAGVASRAMPSSTRAVRARVSVGMDTPGDGSEATPTSAAGQQRFDRLTARGATGVKSACRVFEQGRTASEGNDPPSDRPANGLRAVLRAELAGNRRDVELDGLIADRQARR